LLDVGAANVIAAEEVDPMMEAIRITDGNGARVSSGLVGGSHCSDMISSLDEPRFDR
jgi:hypothetical protein